MDIWVKQTGSDLAQGDLLPDCAVAMVEANFEPAVGEFTMVTDVRDLIVVTQSCDLAARRHSSPRSVRFTAWMTSRG